MWAIVATTNNLKFYDFNTQAFVSIDGIEYVTSEHGLTRIVDNHDLVVKKLIRMGFPIFTYKKDARKALVAKGLTGVKYLELKPTVLAI